MLGLWALSRELCVHSFLWETFIRYFLSVNFGELGSGELKKATSVSPHSYDQPDSQ